MFPFRRPHLAGAPNTPEIPIWGPGDIEGHLGADNRFYVLDYARCFPPEHPAPSRAPEKGSVFFRLLRPELVKGFRVPLSPDALVGWGRRDPQQAVHNQEVLDATLLLREQIVPTFASEISSEAASSTRYDTDYVGPYISGLCHRLHANGINMRYLGLVRKHATEKLQHCCLAEMVARVFKSRLNAKLRTAIASDSGIAIERCLSYAIQLLNLLVSTSTEEKIQKFWTSKIKFLLLAKYESSLLEEEYDLEYDMRSSLADSRINHLRQIVFQRFIALAGIQLSEEAQKLTSTNAAGEILISGDVSRFIPKIKHMVLGDSSYASAKFLWGLRVLRALQFDFLAEFV